MWATLFFVTHTTLSLVIIARVLLRPRVEPSVRLAWIMVVEAVPLLGIAAYLLFGEVRMKQAEVQRMSDVRDRLTGLRTAVPAVRADRSDPAGPIIAANEAVVQDEVQDGVRTAPAAF